MLVNEKLGNLQSYYVSGRVIDVVKLEWYETLKRIIHKRTTGGRELTMKFLQASPQLTQDDIIYADQELIISVEIEPCETIILQPATMYEMAYLCYEIGNKHLPLFYENEQLLIPYEAPLERMLKGGGFTIAIEKRKLLRQITSSVSPHFHNGEGGSLFSRIMQLTKGS